MAGSTPTTGRIERPPLNLSGRKNRRFVEHLVRYVLIGCSLVTVGTTIGIIAILLYEAWKFFGEVPVWDFLFGTTWTPLFEGEQQEFGVVPLVMGTLMTTAVSAVISIPLGLAAAIYLSEIAGDRARSILKPALELLAGVPTIVYGFFALTFISPTLLDPVISGLGTFNGLSAGIAIGIMALPTVASLSEDAIRAVPRSLREAAYALGATRLETSVRVILPAAISGVIASFILGISRAIGETMIVAVAAGQSPAGQSGASSGWWDLTQSMQTMTGFIAYTFSSDISRSSTAFYSLFGVALLLFVMTFVMNMLSQWVTRRYREEYD
ncbi:MAG TPA: phosphate ABC transporter permease subunit PstC [Thermomicrobiales bacterium]|nr:phosphate ABC transporter permease subunit PstC [Thermomicrobiales bacterium]